MSSQLMDLSAAGDVQRTVRTDGSVTAAQHPRGAGFRVLSRIARSRAAEDDGYAPRHRLENEADCLPAAVG
jgi:hypothetical protein